MCEKVDWSCSSVPAGWIRRGRPRHGGRGRVRGGGLVLSLVTGQAACLIVPADFWRWAILAVAPPLYYSPPSEQAAILANPATNQHPLFVRSVHSCFYPPPHRPHGRCWLRTNNGLRCKKKTWKPRSCCRLCSDCQPGATSNLSAMPASK